MIFCREFHCLPEAGGYLDQPADKTVAWEAYLRAEREGQEMRRKIDETQAKTRQH